jgi:hypothetical protein
MTILEQLAQQRTNAVLSTAVSVAIEKIAEEASREILSDPVFRAELKALAKVSVARTMRDLKRNGRPTATRARRRPKATR